jgi:hypothetical protein
MGACVKVYCLMWDDYETNDLCSVHSTWAKAYDAAKSLPLHGLFSIDIHNVDGEHYRFSKLIGTRKYGCDFEYSAHCSRDVDPSEATP